jgi:hypothetical protein
MTSKELLFHESRSNEVLMLREYAEQMGQLPCGQTTWGAAEAPAEGCQCFSCAARECLENIRLMKTVVQVYDA